ncbi:hypothetical protein BJV77DRAFT_397128, partial [Russula vinacea]
DLVLTLSLCVRLIWPGQCIRIRRKTTGGRGPSILHRTRRSRQNLRGNSVDASNPLRASLQVHLCLRHAKPVDAMVSVQILFHALSCHKYPASCAHRVLLSYVLLLDAHRERTIRTSLLYGAINLLIYRTEALCAEHL